MIDRMQRTIYRGPANMSSNVLPTNVIRCCVPGGTGVYADSPEQTRADVVLSAW
jgi:hypothetical protein